MPQKRACDIKSHALISIKIRLSFSSRRPLELFLCLDAVPEIQIDQTLVWNTRFVRQILKIHNHICSQTKRNLLLKMLRIGILDGFREVVFCFHHMQHTASLNISTPISFPKPHQIRRTLSDFLRDSESRNYSLLVFGNLESVFSIRSRPRIRAP